MVSLYGVKSELFLAMNSKGRLYGTVGVRNCIAFYVVRISPREDLHNYNRLLFQRHA